MSKSDAIKRRNELATGPIAVAVAPLRIEAMQIAKKSARELNAGAEERLAKHDWDINAAAPRGNSRQDGDREYRRKNAIHDWLSSLTKSDPARPNSFRMHAPYYVKMNRPACTRGVLEAMKDADAQYQAYVQKLVFKIGAGVTGARLETFGGVWSHSLLIVRKVIAGRVTYERWQTKRIVNYSVYGLAYLQYPTRQLKG
jgi:hypothetical protein